MPDLSQVSSTLAASATLEQRTKKLKSHASKKSKNSKKKTRIFTPFRAIGLISSPHLKPHVYSLGNTQFITTVVNNTFQVYDADKLNLKIVGPAFDQRRITAIASKGEWTFVALSPSSSRASDTSGKTEIAVVERAKEVARWICQEDQDQEDDHAQHAIIRDREEDEIIQMLIFGEQLLCLHKNKLRIWDLPDKKSFNGDVEDDTSSNGQHKNPKSTTINFSSSFAATQMLHPSTYLNKVLVGGNDGRLQLWNIRTHKLIYEFWPFGLDTINDAAEMTKDSVTVLEQSPALDIVAVGSSSGRIALHNIRTDTTVMEFQQSARVTSISFCTNNDTSGGDKAIMCSSNNKGDIAIWNLAEQRLSSTLNAHETMTFCEFLPGQDILLTSGDNSVKEYVFDGVGDVPRLLKSRSGHATPPTKIRFVDNKVLVSAGGDTLRMLSVVRDEQNFEMSWGKGNGKGNANIVDFDVAPNSHFANLVTTHSQPYATTWSTKNRKLCSTLSTSSSSSSSSSQPLIKCTTLTNCGNFALLGTTSGDILCYNLQSSILRKTFKGHTKEVVGVGVDGCNRRVVSAGLDRCLKFWSFQTTQLISTLQLPASPAQMISHPSSLLAISLSNLSILIIDTETHRIVREFSGHAKKVTDMCFSPDGRWLLSSSLDGSIRTWDLVTGCCVDILNVEKVVTSLTFSASGEFLATTHVGENGIFLWINKSQYQLLDLKPLDEELELDVEERVRMPTIGGMDDNDVGSDSEVEIVTVPGDGVLHTDDQINEGMVTLSSGPRSKWSTILNLDVIRKRNKPKAPPKKPEKAPFFLPTVAGIVPKFVAPKEESQEVVTKKEEFVLDLETEFSSLLMEGFQSGDYTKFTAYILSLSPSATSYHISTLSPLNGMKQHIAFLDFIHHKLKSRVMFDATQAYLGVYMKEHGELVINNYELLKDKMEDVQRAHEEIWKELEDKFRKAKCAIEIVRVGNM